MNESATSQPSEERKPGPDVSKQADSGENTGIFTRGRLLLLLGAALGCLFFKVLLGWETFFFRDFGALGYPIAFHVRESLLNGEIPLWNPYVHCGAPFMAQMGQWYPPSLLGTLLPMPWSFNLLILLHLLLGGFGMYYLLRRWNVGGFPAAFAAFAYVFNGVTFSSLTWNNYIASLALVPWVVVTVSEAWKRGGRWMVAGTIFSALQVLTGTPELTVLTWFLIGIIWISEVAVQKVALVSSLGRLLAIVALAAGLSMVQMLPFFDLLQHSQRDQNYAAGIWSMPGWGWANLVAPLFYTYQGPQGQWFQWKQEFLLSYYLGAGVLALAIVGAWKARSRMTWIFAGVALFCWVMALGSNGHVYDWVKKVFPLVGIARFSVKFTLITGFLVACLAAFGIEYVLSQKKNRSISLIVVSGILLGLTAAAIAFAHEYPLKQGDWNVVAKNSTERALLLILMVIGILAQARVKSSRIRIALQIGVLAILPLDAVRHSPKIAPTFGTDNLAPGLWQAAKNPTPPRLGEGRVMLSPIAEQRFLYSRVKNFEMDFAGKRLAQWYNLNLLDGIPKVTGAMTLRPAHFDQLERYMYYTRGARYGEPLLDFLSVRFASSPNNAVEWVVRTNHLPVITAGQNPVYADDQVTLGSIASEDFDPRTSVYLPESARSQTEVTNRTTCSVQNVSFKANRVDFQTDADASSMVVLSQTFYNNWQAYVDDEPVPLWRANLAFQALQVPAGKHQVRLVYRDSKFVLGGIISLLSLAVCGVLWVRSGSARTKADQLPSLK